VLALAWRYEITAEGLKPTADASPDAGTGGRLARRLTLGSVAAVALAIAALIVWRATPVGSNVVDTPAPTVAEGVVDAVPSADPRPSVAVLPFQNRSDAATDRYFADGMHDDILTQLAKIAALKVIARTSVEQFRDTRLTTRQIGAELGVRTVLEGGVQRVGDRVRINMQLIDARDDAHLWAETYDRVLTAANMFAIQSEVAAAVAAALETTLTPAEQRRVEAVPTRSLAAWEAYQLGQQRLARGTTESLAEAKIFFERAINEDPRFALAQVGLAETMRLQIGYSGAPRAETLERVAVAVDRALAQSPELPEALVVQAQVAQDRDELERAEAAFRRALQLAPNNARAHQFYSRLLSSQARREEALHHAERAVALDPL
jgi:TolB-like protein